MISDLLLAAAVLAVFIFVIIRSKSIMTVQESLQSLVDFNVQSLAELNAAVDAMPDKIAAVVQKAIADYLAENPGESVGSVPDDVLIAAIQTMTDQSRGVRSNAAVVTAYLDNQIVHGDPHGGALTPSDE